MISFLIVGSGYRSEYYGRIAKTYPDLFRALFLCRSEEKVQLIKHNTGIEATTSLEAAISFAPDFVVVAVDRGHIAKVAEEWALRGFPVITETPVGESMESLKRIWDLCNKESAKIVCCEQYYRQPMLSLGLSLVEKGLIGKPSTGYLSMVHDYHAASILRKMMLTDGEDYVIRGERKVSDVVATDSRYEAFYDGHIDKETRDIIHIDYASGKSAIYDFSSVEYRSYIRSRHIVVRGERGEWNDRIIYYLDDNNNPQKKLLMPEIPAKYRILDTQALRDDRRTWQCELQLNTLQDEFAIATMLLDMKDYINGGQSPYPLTEALEDAVFWLMVQQAVLDPWKEICLPDRPWK